MPDHTELDGLDSAERALVLEAKHNPEVFRAVVLTKMLAQEKHCRATVGTIGGEIAELKENDTAIFKTIGKLKQWKAWILGGLAAIGGVLGILAFLLLLFSKLK